MNIDLRLEEDCKKCYGGLEYWDYDLDETVQCDCIDGVRLTETGQEIIELMIKYRNVEGV